MVCWALKEYPYQKLELDVRLEIYAPFKTFLNVLLKTNDWVI